MRNWILLLLLLATVSSCRYKVKDGLNWDQNVVSPLLKSRMGLADAIGDNNVIQTNPDNSLTVVFRDTLVDLALSDYLTVPDTSFAAKITLDSIRLATDTLTQDITLGQIARQLRDQGNPMGQILLDNHGQTLWIVPPINDLTSDDIAIDASQFFQEADLIAGWIVVQVDNQLPVDITSVTFHLRNNGIYSDTLVRKTLNTIPAFQMRKDSADLTGKTVEGMMAGKLEDIDIAGGNNVPIDTNDYIRLTIIVRDLRASRATAVFPAQTVINNYSRVNYRFDNGMIVTKLKAKSGDLRITAISTLQDTIEFDYRLPTAIKNGQPVRVVERLIPDINTGIATANVLFDLSDYYIDLTLNGDSVNIFPYHLLGNMLYSGRLATMDITDSIDLSYGLFSIKPAYIEGYLGQETFNFKDTIRFDFFNSILGGTLNLQNPKVNMTVYNSIGVDGEMRVTQMDAINTRTNQRVALTGSITNGPTEIRGPRLPNVGQTIMTPIQLNQQNSNISSFISLLPDQIVFDMSVLINKSSNPALRDNFATDKSRFSAYLDIEVPLHGITDMLWLQDTFDLNLGSAALPKGIEDGNIKLIATNEFPFDADVQVYFVDGGGSIFDSLFVSGPSRLAAGRIDQNGYVSNPTTSELKAPFDQPRLEMLRTRGKRAIMSFKLSTRPSGTPVKLYTTYGIDFHLVGDFRYHIGI